MAGQKQALTASNIKYLFVMQELNRDGRGVRCVDIAETLKITRPSVHAMMNTLMSMGLIKKDRYGTASFTDSGVKLMSEYSVLFESVCKSLRGVLCDEDNVKAAACAVLAEIPLKNFDVSGYTGK